MINYPSSSILPAGIESKREQAFPQSKESADLPISVVIISYNTRDLLRDCLASIKSERASRVIVIDNASSDGSDEMVARDFPWVRLIRNQKNEGYGAAANLAIASCSSKYVLLLNSDTQLQPGTLQALSEYLDQHPKVAVVGPSLVNPDGTRQSSCFHFPAPLQILLRETSLPRLISWLPNLRLGELSNSSPCCAQAVPWVLGAALAIRRLAFESVGGFDRSFFMYYEEVDLCYRLDKSGWQIHFTPAATVTHIGGTSTKQQRAAMAIQLYKSLCCFYRQHYSHLQRYQLKLVLTYLMLRNIAKETYRSVCGTHSSKAGHPSDNLQVWRFILYSVWAKNGWLKS